MGVGTRTTAWVGRYCSRLSTTSKRIDPSMSWINGKPAMRRCCILGFCVFFASAAIAEARPAHKQAFADYFGHYLPRKLNDCRTCHLPDPPGVKLEEGSEKPHNAFGARLKAVKD